MTAGDELRIRADFGERVVVRPEDVPWVASPMAGVERRMLDRVGGEVARATSFVRYAPGSRFSPHVHGGGEEFLVLEGVFAEERGDYPAGFYVRNPPGSRHAPFARTGCTIYVKLWQFEPDDDTPVVIDTRAATWTAEVEPGVARLPLHAFGPERVGLERWTRGARPADRDYPGGVELLVLEGAFEDAHGTYPAGTWLRAPPGTRLAAHTREGCLLYVKHGHLPLT